MSLYHDYKLVTVPIRKRNETKDKFKVLGYSCIASTGIRFEDMEPITDLIFKSEGTFDD